MNQEQKDLLVEINLLKKKLLVSGVTGSDKTTQRAIINNRVRKYNKNRSFYNKKLQGV